MVSNKKKSISGPGNLWIISKDRNTYLDLSKIYKGLTTEPVKEYRISDIAEYMLNPNPIEVLKKLVGCEIQYQSQTFQKIKEKIRKILPQKLRNLLKEKSIPTDVFVSPSDIETPPLKDENLELHFNKIEELLRPYHSVLKRLSTLDRHKISEIIGICEDINGNRSLLNLIGNIDEKISYVVNFISKDVRVVLESAYIGDGLFEMRGFDFESYDPNRSHRLIKFIQDGKPKACVLGLNNRVLYWIEDIKLIHYMHLLEQSIQTNSKLQDSLNQCREGRAKPSKCLFNKQLEIDYSSANPPEIYRKVFETCHTGSNERAVVMNSLNNLQIGVSFSYVSQSNSSDERLFTSISVMHNLKALEPIRDNLPQLYSEIKKRASVSGAGRFYLLDSIRGCIDGQRLQRK